MPLGANKAAIMGVAGVSTGDVVLIQSQTADGDTTLSFTSGLTSTYGEYIFKFYNIGPATDAQSFSFQGSIDGGSNYNVTMTTTFFQAQHQEDGANGAVNYQSSLDQAQGTAFQPLTQVAGNGADECLVGELHLFNPAGTTYVKHYFSRFSTYHQEDKMVNDHTSGYFNTTDNIDAIQFKFGSGNFDGNIKLWGVK